MTWVLVYLLWSSLRPSELACASCWCITFILWLIAWHPPHSLTWWIGQNAAHRGQLWSHDHLTWSRQAVSPSFPGPGSCREHDGLALEIKGVSCDSHTGACHNLHTLSFPIIAISVDVHHFFSHTNMSNFCFFFLIKIEKNIFHRSIIT